jgi:hypothetical protein
MRKRGSPILLVTIVIMLFLAMFLMGGGSPVVSGDDEDAPQKQQPEAAPGQTPDQIMQQIEQSSHAAPPRPNGPSKMEIPDRDTEGSGNWKSNRTSPIN